MHRWVSLISEHGGYINGVHILRSFPRNGPGSLKETHTAGCSSIISEHTVSGFACLWIFCRWYTC